MGFYFVDPETYKKYKDEVMQYSQSVQIKNPSYFSCFYFVFIFLTGAYCQQGKPAYIQSIGI